MSDAGTSPDHIRDTALDFARDRPARTWPDRVVPDAQLLERLNREWRVGVPSAPRGSLKAWLTLPLRAAAAALLRPQQPFNSVVVQLLNHLHHANAVAADRQDVLHAMLDDAFGRIEALAAHVDFIVDERMDEIRRYSEALAARERRLLDAVTALRDDHAEIRTAVNVLGHETRYLSKAVAGAGAAGAGAPAPAAQPTVAAGSADALAHKYVGFEDEFRGSQESIREGVAAYVPLFAGASDVLDVGCGRGEFLLLLRERGIRARGIDLNESMVDVCRARGLEATVADALSYVRAQPDGSLGGLFAAQVVEHLPPVYLTQLLDAAFEKLRPGAAIVLETINPACWFAFFSSYIRDITHERALHPETLKFLLVASGFQQVTIRYSAPYPDHDKLQTVTGPGLPADAAETLNANVEKINRLLFTYLDYAAIGRRP